MCVFYLKKCVCEVIPGGFWYLPSEKFTARSHPGESSSLHRGTETGCFLTTSFRHIERLHYMMIN